ncbi:bZIP transcription factor 17-like [Bidens hawaiensis]|uniref:bZIP transcription factor 17-like n=1 Tax=Bidens hawaiensis TaxID=980011 RepID=UPI00404AED51
MTDAPAIDDPLSSLLIPPLSPYILSNDDLTFDDDFFSFDDDQFFINQSHPFDLPSPDPEEFIDFVPDCETAGTVSGNCSRNPNFTSPDGSGRVFADGNVNLISELRNDSLLLGNCGSDGSGIVDVLLPDGFGEENVNLERILNNSPSELRKEDPVSSQGSGSCGSGGLEPAMNYPSPDSGNSVNRNLKINFVSDHNTPDDSGRVFVDGNVNLERILNNSSSELRNENPVSSGSEHGVNCPSPDSGNSVVNRKMKCETASNIVLKRKNEGLDVNSESRTIKNRRSNEGSIITESLNQFNETDDKKKARLIRNRESAQLSRQRKKQYVEELEDKVKAMHATIMDLNARVSYFAAENATLKQQMVAGGGGGGMCSPPVMYPPHPAMAPVGYPWMQYPPYVVKSHGSQVPLLPIPKLKTQQPASSQKSKKDVKKTDSTSRTKTRKVASISFIGLLLFIVLFGGLVPIMNVKFGGVTDGSYLVKPNYYKFDNQQHQGRVLMSDEHVNGTNLTNHNASEPLVASLYVPRNNKLVKIDGSLIISSVLASEKAMAFREEQELVKKEEQETVKNDDTGLAVVLDLVPAIPIPTVNRVGGRQPHMYRTSSDHQRALPSNEENLQSKHVDGNMQQWFREGLSGLMLSSGMCTEVFQFDASVAGASGAIVPATSAVNITATENHHNSTHITTVKNRRILHSLIPLSDSSTNITKEQVSGHDSKHEDHLKNNSMVVSVLVDPREAGDGGDVDGVMGGIGGGGKGKSFSRMFVVVLLDSVKYVTYSCMLPLKGGSHVVTA